MLNQPLLCLAIVSIASACAIDLTEPQESGDFAADAATTPRGTYLVIPAPDDAPAVHLAPGPAYAAKFLVYLNRDGGTYQPGNNDASTNQTTVAKAPVQFLPWDVSDEEWSMVLACVRDQFARFNLELTDQDPGQTAHIEAVMSGLPQYMGLEPDVGGVSPFRNDCGIIPRSIVFVFTDNLPQDMQLICEIAAQEIAHSFGLDHEYLAADPMSYLPGGPKTFQDVDAPCGENEIRPCACGEAAQNSVQMLYERVGPANAEGGPAPTQPPGLGRPPDITGGCSATPGGASVAPLGLLVLGFWRRRCRNRCS